MSILHRCRRALCTALLALPAEAAEDPVPAIRRPVESFRDAIARNLFGLKVAAYGDAMAMRHDGHWEPFAIGKSEAEFTLDFCTHFKAMATWTQVPEGGKWGVACVDFRPSPSTDPAHPDQGLHIQAGRFDVPFGNDTPYFASRDSLSISRPLTTDINMDGGYNDKGLRLLWDAGSYTLSGYALHGFGSDHLYGLRTTVVPLHTLSAPGTGRLELGASAFTQRFIGGRHVERAWAVDGTFQFQAHTTRWEYVVRQHRPVDGPPTTHRGWHVTQEWTPPGPLPSWFARLEQTWGLHPNEDPAILTPSHAPILKASLGLRQIIQGTLHLKAQIQRSLKDSPALLEHPEHGGTHLAIQAVLVF